MIIHSVNNKLYASKGSIIIKENLRLKLKLGEKTITLNLGLRRSSQRHSSCEPVYNKITFLDHYLLLVVVVCRNLIDSVTKLISAAVLSISKHQSAPTINVGSTRESLIHFV